MNQEIVKTKERPKVELFAKLYENFTDPQPIAQQLNKGMKIFPFGSKSFTKILLFANEVQLTNNDIDYWCHQKPQRQENEDYKTYKSRLKFTQLLDKYRPYLYLYPNTEKKYSKKRATKVMKKLGII